MVIGAVAKELQLGLFDIVGESRPKGAFVPKGTRVYAVGDIHGCLSQLVALRGAILADARASADARKVVVYLGDYIDRGPSSRDVIDLLIGEPLPDFRTVHLIGNHESFMLKFLTDASVAPGWFMNGGRETLISYGVDPMKAESAGSWLATVQRHLREVLPAPHYAFLRDLRLRHAEGDYLFVHAGVRPGVPLDRQDDEDLIWIREPFLQSGEDHGMIVVHGHSPTRKPVLRRNRIGVDTGACYGGPLSALVLHDDRQHFLQA